MPQATDTFLWLHPPAVIFQAQVDQSTFTYPILEVAYDNVAVGAYTDILPELTVVFGTTQGGDDLGRQRIRADGSGTVATASAIYFGRSSQGINDGEVNLMEDAWITVLDLRRVEATPPYITDEGVVFKDGEIAFDANYAQRPVANAGPDMIALVNDSNEIEVSFAGIADSFTVHPDADGSLTYAWDFGDGTPSSSTSAKPSGVTFPAGTRYVSLTVTDSLSNTDTAYALVAAVSRSDLVDQYRLMPRTVGQEGQSGLKVEIKSDIPYGTYPDGTEVLIFKIDKYGSTLTNGLAGATGREHILFAGWLHSENNEGEGSAQGFQGQTTIELHDVVGRLKALPGFPQTVERDQEPDSWFQLEAANIDRYMHYLMRWHCNVLSRVDWSWSTTGDTYAFPTFSSNGQSLYQQFDVIAQAMGHKLTCTPRNQLQVKPDPQIRAEEDRTNTVILEIGVADWQKYEYSHIRVPRIHWNWSEAVLVSTVDADELEDLETAFVVAPGASPGQGVSAANTTRQIAVDVDELKAREGNRYAARMNAPEGLIAVTLTRGGDIGIDPCEMEWVQFVVTDDTAGPRGRTFTTERFLPVQVKYTYNDKGQIVKQQIVLEKEVIGTDAVAYTPAGEEFNNFNPQIPDIDITFPPIEFPGFDPLDWYLLNPGLGSMAAINEDGNVYITDADQDWNTASAVGGPLWTQNAMGASGTAMDWVVDPVSPGYDPDDEDVTVKGRLVTSTGVYLYEDDDGAISVTLEHTFADTTNLLKRSVETTRAEPGVFYVCSEFSDSTGVRVARTTDNGASWAEVQVTAFANTDENWGGTAAIWASSKVPGLVRVIAYDANNSAAVYQSTDYGVTWAKVSPEVDAGIGAGDFHVPFDNDTSDSLIFVTQTNGGGVADRALLKGHVGSNDFVDVAPTLSGYTLNGWDTWTRRIISADISRQKMVGFLKNYTSLQSRTVIFRSLDGGENWEPRFFFSDLDGAIDWDDDYWLSPPYSFGPWVWPFMGDWFVQNYIDLDTYAGGTAVIMDYTFTRFGTGNLRWTNTGDLAGSVGVGTGFFSEGATLKRSFVDVGPQSVVDPPYNRLASCQESSLVGPNPRFGAVGQSGFEGGEMAGTVRVLVDKAVQPFPSSAEQGEEYLRGYIAGENSDTVYLLGDGILGYSPNFLDTLESKSGNLSSFSPGVFLAIYGRPI